MKRKRIFTICIVAVACLVVTLCESCSVEESFSTDSYTYTMQIDAVLNGFDGSATRSTYDWPNGAKLYVQFYEGENRVQGFAEYSEANDLWTVTTRTGLSHVSNARCEAYYFGHSAETADVVELSENVAVYQDVAGSYICDGNGLFVSLVLAPRTGRIRFCGEVGRSFTVSGLTHLSTYEISSNNFSSTSKSLSLTVSEDGYTPYLYANLPDTSRTLTIIDDNMKYTRECAEAVLLPGRSGSMTLPSAASHDGWVMEDINQIDESAVAEAIDLGLSVEWASWNMGATAPEEYGGYYAWGETEEKSNYTPLTYQYYLGDLNADGYYYDSNEYQNIGSNISGTSYDVAHVKWGGNWRMPTLDEIKELINNCTWECTTTNGIKGHKITGPNGNFIFLPAAGNRAEASLYSAGEYGRYWSATLENFHTAYDLDFHSTLTPTSWHAYLDHGLTVRPVWSEKLPESEIVTVTTYNVSNITADGATLGGVITNANQPLTCGIIYDTSSTLSSTNGMLESTSSSGEFSVNVTGLSANTTYYYCAYVVVDGEYRYGEVLSFTTESETITVADAIDLGLSVKWASWNVGATAPEEYGGYYAWGETEVKDDYSVDTYLYYLNGVYVDLGADISGTEYDVAHVKWGDGWRMPTLNEIKELINNCTWSWTTQNDINGYKVTGSNGNSIFLPAAGYRVGTGGAGSRGSDGYYWSSTSYHYSLEARDLHFYSSHHNNGNDSRARGCTVRSVTAK